MLFLEGPALFFEWNGDLTNGLVVEREFLLIHLIRAMRLDGDNRGREIKVDRSELIHHAGLDPGPGKFHREGDHVLVVLHHFHAAGDVGRADAKRSHFTHHFAIHRKCGRHCVVQVRKNREFHERIQIIPVLADLFDDKKSVVIGEIFGGLKTDDRPDRGEVARGFAGLIEGLIRFGRKQLRFHQGSERRISLALLGRVVGTKIASRFRLFGVDRILEPGPVAVHPDQSENFLLNCRIGFSAADFEIGAIVHGGLAQLIVGFMNVSAGIESVFRARRIRKILDQAGEVFHGQFILMRLKGRGSSESQRIAETGALCVSLEESVHSREGVGIVLLFGFFLDELIRRVRGDGKEATVERSGLPLGDLTHILGLLKEKAPVAIRDISVDDESC